MSKGQRAKRLSCTRGPTPILKKTAPRMEGQMKIFHVGAHQFRESLRELLRELWFSYCSSRGMPFREWNFVFREWNFQRFRKGVGGRGLATSKPPERAPKNLQKCVPLLPRGDREKVQKRGLNLWPFKAFLAPTPSVRQPLFETSEILSSEGCSENTPELVESSENGLFTPRAFFLKLGWSPGFRDWRQIQSPWLFLW